MEDQINKNTKTTNLDQNNSVPTIIYKSKVMSDVLQLVGKVSKTEDTTVLITGDSGTGKELIAQTIHNNSSRKNMSFIAINCGAIAETLIESELFGHEKGAFTDATFRKIGKFEQANGGTLFLDEVGDLSQSAQVKLLRVIQENEFERIGGSETIHVDVRLVTATNRNLEQDIKAGRFREDLYHRIKVFTIHMPSLRERKEDIPSLIEHFADKLNAKLGRTISFSDKVINVLVDYSWPGNVRELINTMEAMIIKASGNIISIDDIPQNIFQDINSGIKKVSEFNQEAQKYRNLVEWFIKEEIYLKGKQCEDQLRTRTKQLDIWQTKQGISGIGRNLINAVKTDRKLFEDIDRENIKKIFDLLFLLTPSFKKEKGPSVEQLLKNWPTHIKHEEPTKKVDLSSPKTSTPSHEVTKENDEIKWKDLIYDDIFNHEAGVIKTLILVILIIWIMYLLLNRTI